MTLSEGNGRGMSNRPLTVFFPCHNEEANVEATTWAALEICPQVSDDYEIIIVDDASTDRTGLLADQLANAHDRVRVVRNARSRGYGGALQAGFAAAEKEWVFYTDGDGQFDFNELPKLLARLAEFDIVSAYRINRQESFLRKFNARAWTTLCNLLLGTGLRDIDCAFKVYPRKLFEQIDIRSTGALIDAEILAKALRRGFRIGQMGVHHYPRRAGTPSGAKLQVIVKAFYELFTLRREIVRRP